MATTLQKPAAVSIAGRVNVTKREAAAAFGVSERTLELAHNRGELPYVRIGRKVLIRVVDLDQWCASRVDRGGADE